MTEDQIDIADMQCWVFRMAENKWNIPAKRCVEIFKDNDILGFIERSYGILHISSYACTLSDVEEMLRNKGVVIC